MAAITASLPSRLPPVGMQTTASPSSREASSAERPLHEKIIKQLDQCETKLDQFMPNFWIQNKVDIVLQNIEDAFACPSLKPFNDWINSTGNGAWYQQLAIFLAKLPLKAARNIIHTIASLIKGTLKAVLYTAAHPLKAPLELAKWLAALAHELTKPEVWTKIGINMMGANIGYAIVTGNPISTLFLAIGGAMTIAGISMRALKAAIYAEKGHKLDAVRSNLMFQAQMIAEEMTTGLCMGFLIGGIQQAIRGIRQLGQDHKFNREMHQAQRSHATQKAGKFMESHHFPAYDKLINNGETLKVYWDAGKAQFVQFPQNISGAQLLLDRVITGHTTYTEISHYVSRTVADGVVITEPVHITRSIPIYTDMIGYQLPMGAYPVPLPLPPVTMCNVATNVVLPASVARATIGKM